MADAIVSFAVNAIGKLLIEEGNLIRGVSEEVRQLHEDLRRMQWLLRHADAKPSARDTIQQWVSEFRGIAYEASDLVEDYALRVASPRKEGFTNTLKKYACIFGEGYTLHGFGLEIQSLRTRISNLTKNFNEYGVMGVMEEGDSSRQQQLRRTYSIVAEEHFVGLENEVEMVVKYLLNEGETEQKENVASIFGMGGLGKTTLARKVYHHPRLKQYFDSFAWICVSQQWQTKDLLQGILVKFIPEQRLQIMESREEELVRQLQQFLGERRCLVVLDDIWSSDAWDCIKHAIPISERGSKILLTTRNRDVATSIAPSGYHHQLRFLTEEESWELLQKKSLTKSSGRVHEDLAKMEELGKKMLKNCGGLPLAVVVLGGILTTKKSLGEWHVVHDNIKSYLETGGKNKKHGGVQKILALSYYDLPWQLKPCFLYLGKFKEDCEIDAETLYKLWMGEGMIFENDRMSGQETTMEVAERYLGELATRCMVQVEQFEEEYPVITRFKSCRLHDLMRDLCLLKVGEENLYKVIDFGQENNIVNSVDLRHERHYGFVLRLFGKDLFKCIPQEQTKHLRSFLCELLYEGPSQVNHQWRIIMSQVNHCKMLRVLAIHNFYLASGCCSTPLGCIGHLIHLRCLRLINCRNIKLPSSLGDLKYLEILDLGDSHGIRIPNVLWKMGHLRHLYLPQVDYGPKLRLDGLISKELEILELFDSRLCRLKHLSKLTNLRAFKATVWGNLKDLEQIINHISNCNYIRIASLDIRGCEFRINSDNNNNKSLVVLEQVLFCKNLHKLAILNGLCKQLPNHQRLHSLPPPGLTELSLAMCGIEEDPMETLEKLPNLRKLGLGSHSFVGKEMICHAMGFPQLKLLQLLNLPNLEKWKVDEGAMPKLCGLRIISCLCLEMIPDGLKSLTTLKELDIRWMPQEFKNRVRIVNGVEGPDYDKIRHVPSITF